MSDQEAITTVPRGKRGAYRVEPREPRVKLFVAAPESLATALDGWAERHGLDRSKALRRAVELLLRAEVGEQQGNAANSLRRPA